MMHSNGINGLDKSGSDTFGAILNSVSWSGLMDEILETQACGIHDLRLNGSGLLARHAAKAFFNMSILILSSHMAQ